MSLLVRSCQKHTVTGTRWAWEHGTGFGCADEASNQLRIHFEAYFWTAEEGQAMHGRRMWFLFPYAGYTKYVKTRGLEEKLNVFLRVLKLPIRICDREPRVIIRQSRLSTFTKWALLNAILIGLPQLYQTIARSPHLILTNRLSESICCSAKNTPIWYLGVRRLMVHSDFDVLELLYLNWNSRVLVAQASEGKVHRRACIMQFWGKYSKYCVLLSLRSTNRRILVPDVRKN